MMKKMIIKSCAAVLILFFATYAYAEPWNYYLRRSAINKSTLEKPAQFQITLPEDNEDSYAIDLGLSALSPSILYKESLWEFALTGEYHRNTQIEKKQEVLLLGASTLGVIGDITEQPWSILPKSSIDFKHDEISDSESILISLNSSVVYLPFWIGKITGTNLLGFLWQPLIGLEYENIFEAKDDAPTGDILRGYAFFDIAVYPLRTLIQERLELSVIAKVWHDLHESSDLDGDNDSYDLIEYSATYYLDENKHYALALCHFDGENPTTGFQQQKFTQVSFKMKF
ncbi:MAG: hypothetical protein GY874_09620 [Desulfobacteraceae bacterium]|nr:hypothetical protein [Desulfobacteraceae bacterium]